MSFNGSDVVNKARSFKGLPYKWGGQTRADGFDCSGLILYTLECLDIKLSEGDLTASDIYSVCNKHGLVITPEEAFKTPGALLFLRDAGSKKIYHIAISSGENTTVEAKGENYGVGEWPIDSRSKWSCAALIPYISYRND